MSAPLLTMSHHVFLTREQRYALQVPESEIDVIGTCCPVWIHNGRHLNKAPEEVFSKYTIRHCPKPEEQVITIADEGFAIKLSPGIPVYLTDVSDGGFAWIGITHKNVIEVEKKVVPIIHFLNVEDLEVLEKTLCYV